jgi:hypothetical protein
MGRYDPTADYYPEAGRDVPLSYMILTAGLWFGTFMIVHHFSENPRFGPYIKRYGAILYFLWMFVVPWPCMFLAIWVGALFS